MSRITRSFSSLSALARRLAADRSGVSAIVTAIALTTLAGFCGLAVDAVMWQVSKRTMQGAADQAALAAATAFRNSSQSTALGDSSTAQAAAYATAIRNGYPSASVSVAPFNNGSSCASNGCLQVTISQTQSQYFTGVFFSGGVSVSASAVGTCNGCGTGAFTVGSTGGNPCVMALDASGKGVITVSGTPTMSLTSCNLYNNSPWTDATILNGGAIVEGCSISDPCGSAAFLAQPNNPGGGIDIPVINNASPAPDPYAGLTAPTVAASCINSMSPWVDPTNSHKFINVPSGTYCGGSNFQGMDITFANNAVIVITQGLDLHSGTASMTGNGVMLYVTSNGGSSQQSKINATTTVNISAPTTGPYAGVAMWFAGGSDVTYNGANSSSYKGAIYAPDGDVSFSGNAASASTCTRLVAASVSMFGTANATFNNSGCPTVAGPVLTASGVTGTTTYTGAPMLVQ